MDNGYDYTTAGFDGFLSRSIDNQTQVNLDSPGVVSSAVRYDAAQVSGMLGDILQVGRILIDGVTGRISVYDSNNNEVIRIGDLGD